jgi:hypothetical protein
VKTLDECIEQRIRLAKTARFLARLAARKGDYERVSLHTREAAHHTEIKLLLQVARDEDRQPLATAT